VLLLLDVHTAPSVAQNLGIGHTSLLYRWKAEILGQEGRAASGALCLFCLLALLSCVGEGPLFMD